MEFLGRNIATQSRERFLIGLNYLKIDKNALIGGEFAVPGGVQAKTG